MRELEAQKRTYRESLGRGAADLQPAAFWGRFFDEYKAAVDEYLELGAAITLWQQRLLERL